MREYILQIVRTLTDEVLWVPLNTVLGHFLFTFMALWTVVVLWPVALFIPQDLPTATFYQTVHDRMLTAFFEASFKKKVFDCVLSCTFSRSLTDRKCVVTVTSLYASHYCRWTVSSCWSCINSCICTCHPIYSRQQNYSNTWDDSCQKSHT